MCTSHAGCVLIVEDEASIREVLAEILVDAGYEVALAAGGREALERIDSLAPRIVLVDLLLDDMNGDDLIAELRRRARLASVPMVLMTGAPRLAPAGERVLRKPFDIDALLAMIAESGGCGCGPR